MPKQIRNRETGKTTPYGREDRAQRRADDMSAKGRKQHAHIAPARRAASKGRGK